jgi:alanine-glyoxylate transaminase/serine-glyoxylate transaminase/serine-pyruvate transaminase
MGDLNELMLLGALAGVEMALRDAGASVAPGSGVVAAEEYWRSSAAPLEGLASKPQPAAVGAGAKG